ncbi:MAG: hypothetical protein DRO11_06725 [Methanobacteriota archaeon]|nr:MAG: hypothetical protein DRO11_06725 [Euryarchaeota archaeon]
MYKAVIFDLFGTLIDCISQREHEKLLEKMAEILSAPKKDFQRLWADTHQERATGVFPTIKDNIIYLCRKLGLAPTPDQVEAATQKRLDLIKKALTPRPDAVKTLSELRSRGLRVGLITNCSPDVPELWGETVLSNLVEEPVFSCRVSLIKPDARIYLLACEKLGVKPETCLYVGDGGSHELTGAARVGMSPVLIRVPEEAENVIRRDVDDWEGRRVSSLTQILSLV